jgi:hypothetical protein
MTITQFVVVLFCKSHKPHKMPTIALRSNKNILLTTAKISNNVNKLLSQKKEKTTAF